METLQVPEAALREALLNAVVHKDYATSVPVQISVTPEKLLIWNPGQLPQDWTVRKLLDKHASIPFNPDIANTFFRAGYIEAWGSGIERMFQACRAAGTPLPEVRYEPTGLWVEFTLLQPEGDHGGSTHQVTPQVTPEEKRQSDLLRVLHGEMSRQEIQQALGLKDVQHFRKTYLQPALEQGLIEMTRPNSPTSRLQKYHLTEKGRKMRRTPS